ncbi:unnamed protein product [Lupinus luteus]|uniref:Disease resistance protein n=1 Tax=Lupinus luteus TaxID=3873 RepID=A0AAV1WGJ4_LUPLU
MRFFVKEIKQVLHDAENMVDEFECERLRNEVANAHVNSRTKVARFFSTSNPLVFRLRMAKQIKELDKRLCRFLSLERNEKIKKVPNSICKLHSLQVLNLVGCTKLEVLPKRLRKLISLRQLGITTKEAVLPENDIVNLNSLKILNIESYENLQSLFVGIKLPILKTLAVAKCGSLKSLPLDINHFTKLETLLVDNCEYLDLTKGYDD